MWGAGATPHRGVWASHCHGLSCCGAQAVDAQAQYLWLMSPATPRHAGSSQTRARTRVPCIGRQTPNHCTTREALTGVFKRRGTLDTQRDTRDGYTQRKGHVWTQKEDGCLHTKERGLRRNQICQYLDLGLLATRTVRKYISVV